MAGRNLELRPREEGIRDKEKIPVVRFPLDKTTEHFKENISGISFSIPFSALLSGKVALFCLISISVHFISPLKAKKKLYDIRRYIYYNFF